MPNGLPEASEVWQGKVSFFSIDTNLIQAAGYAFDAGVLHQLPAKLPTAMSLQLSEIVAQEIVNHKMRSILPSLTQIESAAKEIERVSSIDLSTVVAELTRLEVASEAVKVFRGIVENYAKKCRGRILPIQGANLAAEMFERYFGGNPPFGETKNKKSEFPDAAMLLTLEQYAKENKTKGIIASADHGARNFAATSEYLFCVNSLDNLAALFIATGEHAMKIRARIDAELSEESSFLRGLIDLEIQNHVADSNWTVGEIYSGTVARVEGEVYEHDLDGYEVHIAHANIWQSEDEPGVWIVDLSVSAEVETSIYVNFYVWDSIDREEVAIGGDYVHVTRKIHFKTYLNCGAVTEENDPEEWDTLMDTAQGNYSVNVGEVNPDFGDESFEYDV